LQYVLACCSVLQCVTPHCLSLQHSAAQHKSVCCSVLYVAVRCSAFWSSVLWSMLQDSRLIVYLSNTLQPNTSLCVAACCSVLQYVVVCCSALQCVVECVSGLTSRCSSLQHSAVQHKSVCRSMLQCVAVCCGVLQCVAVCCEVCFRTHASLLMSPPLCSPTQGVCCSVLGSVLQCVAAFCSLLLYVAVCCGVCCSVIRLVADLSTTFQPNTSLSVALCCRVLQSVAECCRVLQSVAAVAVCCSVLQCVGECVQFVTPRC